MGTFSLTQVQSGKNLWIYPDAAGCVTGLTPFGEASNYLCVDEIRTGYNDDEDYVYSSATDLLRDLYSTPTSEWSGLSGTINFIQVYARAKSHLYPQSADGIYKIIMTLDASGCSVFYKSSDLDLLNTYSTLNKVWATNPSTGTDWEWADLSDWQIGVECSSPTLTNYLVSATFRPNGVGDKENLHCWSSNSPHQPDNYLCVDDVNADGYGTYVFTFQGDAGATLDDLYELENHTTETGNIASVLVFYRVRRWDGTASVAAGVKTGGNEYWETAHDIAQEGQWTTYSYQWTQNPDTAAAWTWNDVDNLQAGIKMSMPARGPNGSLGCTQLYVVVKYYAALNPEIRTTQCYARINYDSTVTCTLNKPLEISVDHSRNLKMLNFWSGNRVVFDESRNKKTLVAIGREYGTDACDKIDCVKGIGKFGADIVTSGIGGALDNTFKIASFGWKKITDTPLTYDWILELEYSNLDE